VRAGELRRVAILGGVEARISEPRSDLEGLADLEPL
jgi:hypothetical protein